MIIKEQQELEALCGRLAQNPYLTVDTEFLRDKTYYSRLCLIQLAGPGVEALAIDPIAHDLDLSPLWALMTTPEVVKVFHAARQDMEIFYQIMGALPAPIFDTQVAAMVCGHGDSIAYTALVKSITGRELSKGAQYTDWSRRPLNDKQLSYALDDVTHLRTVYEALERQLRAAGREDWVREEMAILTNPETYAMRPEDAWKRIKIRSDKEEVLAALQALAAWREEDARTRNVPRGRIIKDETLADIALYLPRDVEGLSRIRSLPPDLARGKVGGIILNVLDAARAQPKGNLPKRERREPLTKSQQAALEMLKLLLKINCTEADVATRLVASAEDLEALAADHGAAIPALHGWRRQVFGEDAIALLNGQLFLGFSGGALKKVNQK